MRKKKDACLIRPTRSSGPIRFHLAPYLVRMTISDYRQSSKYVYVLCCTGEWKTKEDILVCLHTTTLSGIAYLISVDKLVIALFRWQKTRKLAPTSMPCLRYFRDTKVKVLRIYIDGNWSQRTRLIRVRIITPLQTRLDAFYQLVRHQQYSCFSL